MHAQQEKYLSRNAEMFVGDYHYWWATVCEKCSCTKEQGEQFKLVVFGMNVVQNID